jgi:AcrR family transcriptional regulator
MMSRVRKRLTAEERRAKILSAAVRAFAVDGYDNTSMDRIAALAGVTKPVLYDHYPSKQALFLTVLESIRDGLLAKGKLIAGASDDPEQKFRRAIDAFLQFVEREPDAARVLLMVPRGDPVAAKLSRKVQVGASAGIASLLVASMPGSAPWRLHAAAEFLKEGLHAVAEWWLEHPGPPREDLVDVVTRLVWRGLQTKEPQRP